MEIRVEVVSWAQASAELRAVRTEVFILEQRVSEALEWDEFDATALHALAYADNEAVGTGRLLLDSAAQARIGRVAVRKAWRNRGVGSALLNKLLEIGRTRGCRSVLLHAQTQALKFYARHGFVAEGAQFSEVDIPHQGMRLEFSQLTQQDNT
jgi:predicted GNAT family N-acyltransferase